MGKIIIPYKPRVWAIPFHNSFKRFAALCLHRRAGKTTAFVNHLQRSATDDNWEIQRLLSLAPHLTESNLKELLRERMYGLVLPTYKQAKYVAWEMLKYYASKIPGIKPNEADLIMKYPNGCKFGLFGADNPDSLRGIPFWGLAFDEYSQHPANIFGEVLSKSLADHLGYAIFGGTIKGKNQLFRTHEAFKNDSNAFALWQDIDQSLKTETGPTIDLLRIALEDDKKLVSQGLMTQEEYDQEWYLLPTAAIKGSIYGLEMARAYKEKRIGIVPYDKALKVHTVWDLGIGKNLVIGFFQRIDRQLRLIDVWQGDGQDGLPEGIRAVQNKPYIYGKHFGPHDLEATDISTGKTRRKAAQTLGIKFEIVKALSIADGINAAKLAFSRLLINEATCALFIDAISAYHFQWDDKKGMFNDQPYHDWASHFADMFRYAAVSEDLMVNEELKIEIPKDSWVPIHEAEAGFETYKVHLEEDEEFAII